MTQSLSPLAPTPLLPVGGPVLLSLPAVSPTLLSEADQRLINTAFTTWGASWRYHAIQRRHVLVIPKTKTPSGIEWECVGAPDGTLLDLIEWVTERMNPKPAVAIPAAASPDTQERAA